MHNLHRRVAHELPPACPKTGVAVACPQGVSSPGLEISVAPAPEALKVRVNGKELLNVRTKPRARKKKTARRR